LSSPDKEPSPTEEAGAVPIVGADAPEPKESSRSFLAPARRNLSEEELAAPGVRRFLIWEIERLESRIFEIQPFLEKYHDLRVEKAGLDEKLKGSKLNDVLSAVCLSAGSAAIGASSKLVTLDLISGFIVLAVAVVLVVAGIVAKASK
jgi:hypothetical protein